MSAWPVHGPPAKAGTPLPIDLALGAWWQGRYRSSRVAVWNAVTTLLPEAPEPGSFALDAGCGMRPFDDALVARGYQVIGMDMRPGSTELLGAVEHLPLTNGAVSAVLCVNVLQYVPSPLEACREMARVLAPGGRLVLCVPALHPFDHLDLWRWTGRSVADLLGQAGLTEVGVVTVGSTAGNLLHLAALTSRKAVPGAGPLVAGLLEGAAVRSLASADHRLPMGYAATGTKSAA